jgi:hypothetical protein
MATSTSPKCDMVFFLASENERRRCLIARGAVTSAEAIAKKRGVARQTIRVRIAVHSSNLPTGMMDSRRPS